MRWTMVHLIPALREVQPRQNAWTGTQSVWRRSMQLKSATPTDGTLVYAMFMV
jgi:hypothetical protein